MEKYRFLKRTKKTCDLKSLKQTWKDDRFLAEQTICPKGLKNSIGFHWKNNCFGTNFLKPIVFYWTNNFIDPIFKIIIIFLLIERFYWTIFQWENERNSWKMNDNFDFELIKYILLKISINLVIYIKISSLTQIEIEYSWPNASEQNWAP